MLDPCILHTEAFKQIADDFSSPIREGPTYICDIYCWKFEYKKVMKLKSLKYNQEVFNISHMCRELQV